MNRACDAALAHPKLTTALVGAVAAGVALGAAWRAHKAWTIARRVEQERKHRSVRVKSDTPYGQGFKNCPERVNAIELEVEGALPEWLEGKLFRSGPGTFEIATRHGFSYFFTHWFDCATVMHGFEIKEGRVFYANRKAARELEEYIARVGANDMTFGPDPCRTLFGKLSSLFQSRKEVDPLTGAAISNVGVTIKKIKGELYNQTDANVLMRFDPETLKTTGRVEMFSKFHPKLKGMLTASHGQYDAKRGEYYNFVCDIGFNTSYTTFVIPDQEDARVLTSIPADKPSYLHSFALTENYFILQLWPTYLSKLKLWWRKSVLDSLEWDANSTSKFHVVDRRTGELVHTYEAPAAFSFHNINAWEEEDGNEIVMDLSLYKDAQPLHGLLLDKLLSEDFHTENFLARITLTNVKTPGNSRTVHQQIVFDCPIELPRINPSVHMRPYRFVYGVSVAEEPGQGFFNRIVKVDVLTGDHQEWKVDGHFPAEPIFLPAPGGNQEDEGILLSIVLNGEAAESYLLVLNAQDLSTIAKAQVPHHIPFGFHGNFFGSNLSSDLA